MKVKMLRQTCWQGKVLLVGSETDVATNVAKRWSNHNIAEMVGDETLPPAVDVDDKNKVVESKYAGMKAKELYEMCVQRGIAAEARQSGTHYVDLLELDDLAVKE